MMKNVTINVTKVDVDELVREFKVLNMDVFVAYLKEVWRDLAQRSEDKLKGVNKITFSTYYELPGIISDRLYAVFDKNQNGFMDVLEFIEGMKTLFSENFDKTSKFIFDFYDFDKDGLISKEDIRTVLSYVPLNTKGRVNSTYVMKYEQESFKDRVESQEELYQILEKCFKTTDTIDYKEFLNIVENVCSDIYFFILIFLMEKRPFSKQALTQYEKQRTPTQNNTKLKLATSQSPLNTPTKLVASPNIHSKFSPSITISKSPILRGTGLSLEDGKNQGSKNLLSRLTGKTSPDKKRNTTKENKEININSMVNDKKEATKPISKVPVNRKVRNNLKMIEDVPSNKINLNNEHNDLPISPAVKLKIVKTNSIKQTTEVVDSPNQILVDSIGVEINIVNDNDDEDENCDDEKESVKFEGYLYKITESKSLKKLWFKLFDKDFYYFKNENETIHKGMHTLSGVFVKEEKPTVIDGNSYYTFSVSYPKKVRFYYASNEEDMKLWVANIKKATGYQDLADIYDIKEKLGNGKFGLVRLGIHKQTGKKVAIKIMSKKEMNNQDLELLKTEIEILKISQHPYIIRLYDVFENIDYVYVIMEYCEGGDLFSYIEKRGFRLPEQRTCQLIHRLCTATYYIHSYGITHRDLKPENILMTDNTDEADLRIVDFGLSKIIGPNETCTEPYGTLSYVAPEVLIEQPYTKAVDLWSIGIITYLLLAGYLPFDDESSEREIARKTIHEPVRWGSIWKKLSGEAKSFVDNLLQKDPTKRMTINQVLEHPWLQKLIKTTLPEIRKKSKDFNSSTFKIYTSTDEILKDD